MNAEQHELFEKWSYLARKMANRWVYGNGHGWDYPRFENAALVGLWECVLNFDQNRGVKFKTMMTLRVFGEMMDEARRMDEISRWSRLQKESIGKRSSLDAENRQDERSMYQRIYDKRNPDVSKKITIDDEVRWAMKQVPSAQMRRVLHMYYWLELTMREIGKRLNLSETRVCQIHKEAIAAIRERAHERGE